MRNRKTSERASHPALLFDGLVVDNFAGGGGASMGIEQALGRAVDVAINHDAGAVAMHRLNHPHTRHYTSDVFEVDPREVTAGRPVDLCWFSPDCKHFSRAKGSKPVAKRVRGLAWVVVKWAQRVAPRVIMLENVREFETWGPLVPRPGPDGSPVTGRDGSPVMVPCPRRKGKTFRLWVSKLRRLGYRVEWRTLDAADFGAPTHRKRLFLVARRDGLDVAWPEPTHGPGRAAPYRTAAECIDWSLPTPSIFLSREEGRAVRAQRPLAEKTMKRIAMGLRRFVLEHPDPFIVTPNHGGAGSRCRPAGRPLPTVTARHRFGLVAPFLAQNYGEAPHQQTRGQRADRPLRTVTPNANAGVLVTPYLTRVCQNGSNGGNVSTTDRPLTTVVSKNEHCLTAVHLSRYFGGMDGRDPGRPLPTVTAVDHHAVVAAALTQYNGLKGNEARGQHPARPLHCVTTEPRFALVTAFLTKFYGTGTGRDPRRPAPATTADGLHTGAYCLKYHGSNLGHHPSEPLHTQTSRHRFGVVTVRGVPYRIADIGLRMLTPRELFRCQGFPDSYQLAPVVAGKPLGVTAQVRMCGNSVAPPVARALVLANLAGAARPLDEPVSPEVCREAAGVVA